VLHVVSPHYCRRSCRSNGSQGGGRETGGLTPSSKPPRLPQPFSKGGGNEESKRTAATCGGGGGGDDDACDEATPEWLDRFQEIRRRVVVAPRPPRPPPLRNSGPLAVTTTTTTPTTTTTNRDSSDSFAGLDFLNGTSTPVVEEKAAAAAAAVAETTAAEATAVAKVTPPSIAPVVSATLVDTSSTHTPDIADTTYGELSTEGALTLAEELGWGRGDVVLDVGSGEGSLSALLMLATGGRTVGIEIDPSRHAHALSRWGVGGVGGGGDGGVAGGDGEEAFGSGRGGGSRGSGVGAEEGGGRLKAEERSRLTFLLGDACALPPPPPPPPHSPPSSSSSSQTLSADKTRRGSSEAERKGGEEKGELEEGESEEKETEGNGLVVAGREVVTAALVVQLPTAELLARCLESLRLLHAANGHTPRARGGEAPHLPVVDAHAGAAVAPLTAAGTLPCSPLLRASPLTGLRHVVLAQKPRTVSLRRHSYNESNNGSDGDKKGTKLGPYDHHQHQPQKKRAASPSRGSSSSSSSSVSTINQRVLAFLAAFRLSRVLHLPTSWHVALPFYVYVPR